MFKTKDNMKRVILSLCFCLSIPTIGNLRAESPFVELALISKVPIQFAHNANATDGFDLYDSVKIVIF